MNWDNFFMAQAGAAAALTGLIFVAVSINLTRILAIGYLPSRALQSLTLLVNILVVSSLLLIPKQSLCAIGIEVLIMEGILWVITLRRDIYIHNATPAEYKKTFRFMFFLTQLAMVPFLMGGICLLIYGGCGIYFLVAGILFSYIKAITDSWVLLVEINR